MGIIPIFFKRISLKSSLRVLKMLKTFILHENNNAIKFFIMSRMKNCLIYNQVTYPFFRSNEFIHFSESIWIFLGFVSRCWKYRLWKIIKIIIVKLFVQSPQKIFSFIWNLVTKTYPESVKLLSFFEISIFFENVKNKKLRGYIEF